MICSIAGCEKPARRRGWCSTHYGRWFRNGDPLTLKIGLQPFCSVDGCNEKPDAKGYCNMHYQRWIKHGNPLVRPSTTVERFWRNVNKDGPVHSPQLGACWIWMGGRDPKGYGRFCIGNNAVRAHRYSYQLVHGPIGKGLLVRHRCDNPSCVRPDHLEQGTPADNSADMVRRGRSRRRLDRCSRGHEFTPENTAWHKRGEGQVRECIACRRVASAARYRAIKEKSQCLTD